LPDGIKNIPESAFFIASRLATHLSDLKQATEDKNMGLHKKIIAHISQILALAFRIAEFRMKNLSVPEIAKIVNICIVITHVISKSELSNQSPIFENLLKSQELIYSYIQEIIDQLKSAITIKIKEINSLSNLGMKPMYQLVNKHLENTTSELAKIYKWIYVLPTALCKKIIGELINAIYDHICDKIIEVRGFSKEDIEGVTKFMKPFFEYEQFINEPTKSKQQKTVFFVTRINLKIGRN